MNIDYYKILKVPRDAGIEEIKKAYRLLAMQYHPDRNPGCTSSEDRFKLITEAYEVLKDRRKRAVYDSCFSSNDDTFDEGFAHNEFYARADEELAEFLSGFYGRQTKREKGRAPKKKDVRCNVKVSFQEAARGTSAKITIPRTVQCPRCGGTGVKAGAKIITCTACSGRGSIRNKRGRDEQCTVCNGSGNYISALCRRCKGNGSVTTNEPITVHIPPGVETGTRIPLRDICSADPGCESEGDAFVVVHVKKHPLFYREGNDVICPITVPVITAMLGAKITVPTIDGIKNVTLAQGTSEGRNIRLKGKGIAEEKENKRGDFIIRISVEMPKKISQKDKKILKDISARMRKADYPRSFAIRDIIDTLV